MTSSLYESATSRSAHDDDTRVLDPIEMSAAAGTQAGSPDETAVRAGATAASQAGPTQAEQQAGDSAWNGIAPDTSGPPGLTTVSLESRGRRLLRALRTFAAVVILLGAAVAGGVSIARERLDARAYQDLGGAVLTTPVVPVGASTAATVTAIHVTERSHVSAGQALADVTVVNSADRSQTQVLRAPSAGTVLAVNLGTGGVATPGQPIVSLYDPAKLAFQVKVNATHLRQLRLGMTVYLSGPGLAGRILARLDHVVPRAGSDAFSSDDQLTVVLVPNPVDVGTLVPGLSFDATVDLRTAPGSVPAVNSAG